MMSQPSALVELRIAKLVPGGQGLAELSDGKKVFVWNALPGEVVLARVIKQRQSYAEAIAEQIIKPSLERVAPQERTYLATSPWQVMTFSAENRYKHQLVKDIFSQAKVVIPDISLTAIEGKQYGYRNKSEFGFWGDETGLHLASYQRGSHGKQIVDGSALNMPGLNTTANSLLAKLNALHVRAGDLKTIIIRSTQKGQTAASLFVKTEHFPELDIADLPQSLRVYYSDPRSPASVRTKLLYEIGDVLLRDMLLGQEFIYDVDSFFQVNLQVYERALESIKTHMNNPAVVDLYSGVGSIGLTVASQSAELVEIDSATAAMVRMNIDAASIDAIIIEAPVERSLDHISHDKALIVDPPRAGLHAKVIAKIRDRLPPVIAYLSCNPVTQARDLALLQDLYKVDYFEAFNFFPRTPHIETLAILHRPS